MQFSIMEMHMRELYKISIALYINFSHAQKDDVSLIQATALRKGVS